MYTRCPWTRLPPANYKMVCTGGLDEYHWHVRENSCITGTEQATTWGGGLGLSMPDISFEDSAHTGYDTSAQITYDFGHAMHVNYVCGTDTVPSNAKRTVVQSHLNP